MPPSENSNPDMLSSRPTSSSFDLHQCQYCERKFSKENDRHLKHEKVCATAKQKDKKRESRKEKELKEKEKKAKLDAKFKDPPPVIPKKDWRATHGEFFLILNFKGMPPLNVIFLLDKLIESIRAAKSYKPK